MTVIVLTALETVLGSPVPVKSGSVTAQYWAGSRAFKNVDGAEVTFPSTITVPIVDGAPVSPVDLQPTAGVCSVRWRITGAGFSVTRYTSIPVTGPVDFGDLPVVDPYLFAPVSPTPTLADYIATVAAEATFDRF